MGSLIINLVGVGGFGFWARDEFWGQIVTVSVSPTHIPRYKLSCLSSSSFHQ